MPNWTTRLFQPGDQNEIKKLYEFVFDTPMPLDLWNWRYLENPTGKVAILLAISGEDGTLAGQYALCPMPMTMGAEDIVGALSLDTMVHPNFQGQRMFTILAEDLYQRIADDGVPVVYGFPNGQSHPGFEKYLKWEDLVEHLPVYVRPLRISHLLAKVLPQPLLAQLAGPLAGTGYQMWRLTRGGPARAFRVTTVSGFDERWDTLWQQARGLAPIMVRRERSYLNWRYVNHPYHDYTIFSVERDNALLGYAVLRIQELSGLQTGFIADLLTLPGESGVAETLIEAVVAESKAKGCDMVSCLMLTHLPYAASLRRSGFLLAPSRVMPQELYLGARNNSTSLEDTFVHDFKNWYITWGDHDRV
jgi:hypothetical protein